MLLRILMLPSTTPFIPFSNRHFITPSICFLIFQQTLANKFPSNPFFFYLHHIFILHQPIFAFHLLHTIYLFFLKKVGFEVMKFGKRLKQQIQESLPEWRDKYLSYKELKKLVRLISEAPTLLNGSFEYGKTENEFMCLLNNDIDKFNGFFMEKEEDFIIRHMVMFFLTPH